MSRSWRSHADCQQALFSLDSRRARSLQSPPTTNNRAIPAEVKTMTPTLHTHSVRTTLCALCATRRHRRLTLAPVHDRAQGRLPQRKAAWALAAALLAIMGMGAHTLMAGEGQVSLYLPGYRSYYAGLMPAAGTYLNNDLIYLNGTARLGTLNLDRSAYVELPTVARVTELKLFGGTYAAAARIPLAYAELHGEDTTRQPPLKFSAYNAAFGDLALVPLALGWHAQTLHTMANLTVYIPVGEYHQGDLVNIGRNHYGIDPGFAATWLDPRLGLEISGAAGLTINFENTATDYTNGEEWHIDSAILQHFPHGFEAGVVGYAFVQLTGDHGAGATQGDFEGQVFGVGPALRCNGKLRDHPANVSLRGYHEFGAIHRYEGDMVVLSAGLTF